MSLEIIEINNSKDQQSAFEVRRIVFIEEQGVDPTIEQDEHDVEATHFLARWNGKPVGAARFRWLDNDTVKVERVAVLKDYRGHKIGVRLMEAIEQIARQKGIRQLKLNAQKHAEPFYLALGYTSYGEPFVEADILHVAMIKKLQV
jgi:predicted GNAT family N-acyltransferase